MHRSPLVEHRLPESAQWTPKGLAEPPTHWMRGRYDEVARALPEFERRPFSIAVEEGRIAYDNELLDVIATRGEGEGGWVPRPLAVVTKSYRLIGHREAVEAIAEALANLGIEPEGLDTHATLARYGARLALEINMPPQWLFDPGDGFPLILQLRCLNSVDATSTLRLLFTWYRLICTNGLTVGFSEELCRVRHTETRRESGIEAEIGRGLEQARADRRAMSGWLERKVSPERFAQFADGPLKDAWGVRDAARFLHIARTGLDADFADRFQPGAPSEKRMVETIPVPGSPTQARSEWDVAQILSWIARSQGDAQSHLERMIGIPALVTALAGLLEGGPRPQSHGARP